jgi:hypothetical protein
LDCYQCGFEVEVKEKIGRQTTCSKCGRYLHCCLNCRFYSTTTYHQCCETQAEWVSDKQAANFCDYFEPMKTGRPVSESRADKAREKLDQLFKPPGTKNK